MRRFACLAVFLVACGGGDSSETPDGPGRSDGPSDTSGPEADGPAEVFALTSSAFSEGGTIPMVHTCNGLNTSPQLDWTGDVPAGTLSFAIVLDDKSFNNFTHSVIYDIPANLTGLPADVEKAFAPADVPGAHQTRSFNNGPNGYRGPCPPSLHTYEFAIYALDVATLSNLDANSSADEGEAEILLHDLAVARLTGTYDQP